MTQLNGDSPLGTTPPLTSPPATSAAAASPATPAAQLEHEQERWARWTTARDRESSGTRRRLQFIAGFIVLGLLAWAFWTF